MSTMVPGLSLSRPVENGHSIPHTDPRRELYQNILRLRDDVFAGKLHSLSLANGFVSNQIVSALNGNGKTLGLLPLHSSSRKLQAPQSVVSSTVTSSLKKSNQPLIDPVLLQKGPELIKAEMEIERNKIEKALIEDFENRPRIPRSKPDIGVELEVDIESLLDQIHSQVPHVSGIKSIEDTANDSFDENSYYSSKANSWSSSKDVDEDAQSDAMAISEGEISEGEFEPEFEAVSQSATVNVADSFPSHLEDDSYQPEVIDLDNDEVYSPPAPISPQQQVSHMKQQLPPNTTVNAQFLQAILGQVPLPPLPPQTVAVNQIETPVAPQPSHISPLATGNLELDHSNDQSSRSEHEQNKTAPIPKENKRKRKENSRIKAQAKKRTLEKENKNGKRQRLDHSHSPETIIKEEPLTPPPFGSVHQTSGRKRANPISPKDHEFRPPPGFKLVPVDVPEMQSEPVYQYHQPSGPTQPPAVFRDAHGNEFYNEPPPPHDYRQPLVPVPRYYQTTPMYEPVGYHAIPQTAATRYEHSQLPNHHPQQMAPPPGYVEYHQAPRAGTVAPSIPAVPVNRAYSVHPSKRTDHYPPQGVDYSSAHPTTGYVQRASTTTTTYGEYVPASGTYGSQSVAPPQYQHLQPVDPYRSGSVVPSRGPQAPPRSVSVYPGYVPGQYHPRDEGRGIQPPPRY